MDGMQQTGTPAVAFEHVSKRFGDAVAVRVRREEMGDAFAIRPIHDEAELAQRHAPGVALRLAIQGPESKGGLRHVRRGGGDQG